MTDTAETLRFDARGKVIPDMESLEWAACEHADKSPAEQYRLAQAHTLLKCTTGGGKSDGQ